MFVVSSYFHERLRVEAIHRETLLCPPAPSHHTRTRREYTVHHDTKCSRIQTYTPSNQTYYTVTVRPAVYCSHSLIQPSPWDPVFNHTPLDTVFSKLYTSESWHSSHTSWNTLLQADWDQRDPRCSSQQPYTVRTGVTANSHQTQWEPVS